jgi:hypothetical protein
MKKAEKPRPKISIRLSLASKKFAKQGLNKVALTLECLPVSTGIPLRRYIYRIRLQIVKKKHKQNKKFKALISKIGWILFVVLVDFFVQYLLTKILP